MSNKRVPVTNDTRVNAQRTATALERIDTIEQTLQVLVPRLNEVLSLQQNQGEVLRALVGLMGQDQVTSAVKSNRLQDAANAMEAEKKALEELKNQGALQTVEKISDKALVVGREYDKDGAIAHPGRVQVAFARIDAEFQPQLLDKPVGTTIQLKNGGKFEVVEIYEVAEKQPAATTSEAPAAPTTAAEAQ